jgi:hypothetical protein
MATTVKKAIEKNRQINLAAADRSVTGSALGQRVISVSRDLPAVQKI